MNKCVKTAELFSCEIPYLRDFFSAHEYPWQMLPEIKELAKKLVSEGIEGFTEIKAGVLVGLGLYALGALLFYPAKMTGEYYPFLAAYFILTCGLSFLETSSNPAAVERHLNECAVCRRHAENLRERLYHRVGDVVGEAPQGETRRDEDERDDVAHAVL